jgi:hypothetical protein
MPCLGMTVAIYRSIQFGATRWSRVLSFKLGALGLPEGIISSCSSKPQHPIIKLLLIITLLLFPQSSATFYLVCMPLLLSLTYGLEEVLELLMDAFLLPFFKKSKLLIVIERVQ